MKDLDISTLKRFEMPNIGVYFLFKGDELEYIGQSINVFRRLNDHLKDKVFDNYSFVCCDSKYDAEKLEKQLIEKYKPRLNIKFKTEDIERSLQFHLKSIENLNRQKEVLGIK